MTLEDGQAHKTEVGPHSLIGNYAGDYRIAFTIMTAELLQMMHPAIAAGVRDHSRFMKTNRGRIERIRRSVTPILQVVYSEHPDEVGKWIRDQHPGINGSYTNEDGQPVDYHALNPDTFWWAHATFQNAMVGGVIERFDKHGLSAEDKELLVEEGADWYSRYGVSTKPVPKTYTDFERKWNEVCDNTLQMTPAAEQMIRMANIFPPARILMIGGLPARVRERFNIPWTERDQDRLKRIESFVKNHWPDNGIYMRTARQGRKRP